MSPLNTLFEKSPSEAFVPEELLTPSKAILIASVSTPERESTRSVTSGTARIMIITANQRQIELIASSLAPGFAAPYRSLKPVVIITTRKNGRHIDANDQ
ncbi:MAG: hypothetical protein RJR37_00570 [Peptococcaceae bacterium MAG4]|nr:hypothetical protein [Peptococcaceae bacterium MAG4]